MGHFLAKTPSYLEEEETFYEICVEKKELKAEKARIDFLDKIHDLKTPML